MAPALNPAPRRRWITRLAAGLFVLAALATLLGFSAGSLTKWHWGREKQQLLASGRLVNPESLSAPPIPDAENFAAVPILREPAPRPKADPPNASRPSSEFDLRPPKARYFHLPLWSESWEEADLAACLAATRLDPSRAGESPAAAILRGLGPWERRLEELAEGARRPRSQFRPAAAGEKPDAPSPSTFLIDATRIFALRSAARVANGDATGAAEDILTILRMGRHLRQDPPLLQQMAGELVSRLALSRIWEGCVHHRWNAAQLTAFEAELAQVDLFQDLQKSLRFELASLAASQEKGCDSEDLRIVFLHATFARISWRAGCFAGLVGIVGEGLQLVESLPTRRPERFQAEPIQARMEALARTMKTEEGLSVASFHWGVNERALDTARNQTRFDLALAALLLEKAWLNAGRYPESAEKLGLPNDLLLGKPLGYEASRDGNRFRLKAIGWVRPKGKMESFPTKEREWVHYSNAGGDAAWK